MTKKKRPYFPNNWQQYKDMPAEDYHTHTFDDVMNHRILSWELPSSIHCVLRTRDLKTMKTEEFVYSRFGNMLRKIEALVAKNPDNLEIVIADGDSVSVLATTGSIEAEDDEE